MREKYLIIRADLVFLIQMIKTKGKSKTRLVLVLIPYTVADLKRLETDQWCFLFNE